MRHSWDHMDEKINGGANDIGNSSDREYAEGASERRKMRSLPETADQLSIYAVEAARMVGEYLRSQIDI